MVENRLTRGYFNGVAEQWSARQTPEQAKIARLLSRLDWNCCETILDLGCGTGVLFPFFEQMTNRRTKVFAVDAAEFMVREAAHTKNGKIKLLCGCARYLPFGNNSMDRIIAFHVLPHVQGKQMALRECWRILKPDGELAIIHLHSSAEINAIHEEVGGIVKNHKLPPMEQVCRMLENANFKIKEAVDQSGEYFVGGIKINHFETN